MIFKTARDVAAHLAAHTPRHLINGRLVASDKRFDVFDPATDEVVAQCFEANREQLDEAVAAARRAQPAWAAMPIQERRACLRRMSDALRANADELAALVTLEQGKPLARARDEVIRSADQSDAVTSIALAPVVLRDDASGRVELRHRPLGVVGAITPWNMPLVLSAPKIAHALYTGNTIVLKPSPYAPLAVLRMGELLRDVFPPGCVNILAGGNDFGAWMTAHPGIDKIAFTGSSATGKRVMASAASNLKRVTLELGGNDPAIVLDDVDVEAVAPKLFAAAFVNSGQVCMAIKRLYVHESIHDKLAAALARIAKSVKVDHGFADGCDYGPVQNRAQYETVKGILEDTQARGATVLAGGKAMARPGYFIEPTIVTGLAEGSRLVDEEPFGPVLPILRFTDVEDAVRRANASPYGLGASVWSADANRAADIAVRLEAGTAWVNRHVGVDAMVPFGGAKQSGVGREFGVQGLSDYTDMQSVFVPAGARPADPVNAP